MNDEAYIILTERQKECLRLVAQGFKDKEIAREIGIHHETVRKHLKAAMARFGTNSRFVAARQLAAQDTGPSRVPPIQAVPDDPDPVPQDPQSPIQDPVGSRIDGGLEELASVLREDRVPYVRASIPIGDGSEPGKREVSGTSPFGRLAMAGVLVLLIAMAVISAIPMSNAVQQMANAIDPP